LQDGDTAQRVAPRVGVQVVPVPGRPPFDDLVVQASAAAAAGLQAVWMGQGFDLDSLTALAVVGRAVPGIDVGVQVVPAWPRHPLVLAGQALTVQAATRNRLTLGVGLSHASTVERTWGLRFDDPVQMLEEYLSVLNGVFAGETVRHAGPTIAARLPYPVVVAGTVAPRVVAGVLGARALRVAARLADGVLTTFTGPRGLAHHVVPIVAKAAADAGRPAPHVIATLPLAVTDDVDGARDDLLRAFGALTKLPTYAAALEREGVSSPVDVAAIGDESTVRSRLRALLDAGATELSPFLVGTAADHPRALAVLAELAR
jgi:F420-dependent oxidoreductase-like protein